MDVRDVAVGFFAAVAWKRTESATSPTASCGKSTGLIMTVVTGSMADAVLLSQDSRKHA